MEYEIKLFPLSEDDGGGYYVEVPKMPGCFAVGETPQETLTMLEEAMEGWKASVLEMGGVIPSPDFYKEDVLPSGRLTLRLPKTMHQELINRANQEGDSLNGTIVYGLSQWLAGEYLEGKAKEICESTVISVTKKISELPTEWKSSLPDGFEKPRKFEVHSNDFRKVG